MKKQLIALGVIGILSLSVATGFAAENNTQTTDQEAAYERMYQNCRDYYNRYVNDNDSNSDTPNAGWCYGPRDNR